MADLPTPRSFQQILGEMIDTFVSYLGLPGLKVGGPILSMLESAAMSDLRSSQDIFDLIAARSIDSATGTALVNIGESEGVEKEGARSASGKVDITDSSFTKIASRVFQGQPAPVAGATTVNVADASAFPATGNVYLGRGLTNAEGPLAYTSVTLSADETYYILHLSGTTTIFHNVGESVILAQGGDRTISAGTVVRTKAANGATPQRYTTNQTVTILDGETIASGVPVIAETTGDNTNCVAGAISEFDSVPFTGATVTNPAPFTNGSDLESDDSYRERIKAARKSRSKGTAFAIQTGVYGITAQDEQARVSSVSVVTRKGYPATVYIDDGSGYEEKTSSIAVESLIDVAVGGEQYVTLLGGTPVARAFVQSTVQPPFALSDGAILAVEVGGIISEFTFNASSFRDVTNATSYEVVAAINGNPDLPYSARTVNSGQAFVLFAKEDGNEDIQVVAPESGTDANGAFGFAGTKASTLLLYKNDRLLYKDGQYAQIETQPIVDWDDLASPETLIISVDGTPAITATFTDSDFIDLGEGFVSLSKNNSLASWAEVFEAKIPGISATVSGGALLLTSNRGLKSKAALSITGGTLVSKNLFYSDSLSATGQNNDYILDRNTGKIRLTNALKPGDRLSAGTQATRAYVQSGDLSGGVTLAADGNVWFIVDGAAQIIPSGITSLTSIVVTSTAINVIDAVNPIDYYVSFSMAGNLLPNVQKGDWVIFSDAAFVAAGISGFYRISDISFVGGTTTFFIEVPALASPGWVSAGIVPSQGGIAFVRSTSRIQNVLFPAGVYTQTGVVNAANTPTPLRGATAKTVGSFVQIATDAFGENGDIAVVHMDVAGSLLGFPKGLVTNSVAHIASVESGNSDIGTPTFDFTNIVDNTPTYVYDSGVFTSDLRARVAFLRPNIAPNGDRPTNVEGQVESYSAAVNGPTYQTTPSDQYNDRSTHKPCYANRVYAASTLAIGPEDDLAVILDGDSSSKSYATTLGYKLKPTNATPNYNGSYLTLVETATNSNPGNVGFPTSNFFHDFGIYNRARGYTHPVADADLTYRSFLWRFKRYGPEGNKVNVTYVDPSTPSQPLGVTAVNGTSITVQVQLPSGPARAGFVPGQMYSIYSAAGNQDKIYYAGFRCNCTTDGSGTYTATLIAGGGYRIVATNAYVGMKIYVRNAGAYPSGVATVTGTPSGSSFTFTYNDGTTLPNLTTCTTDFDFTLGGTPPVPALAGVAVGDLLSIAFTTGGGSYFPSDAGVFRINEVDTYGRYVVVKRATGGVLESLAPINLLSATIYPIDTTQTTTGMAAAINALPGNEWVTCAEPAMLKSGVPATRVPVAISTLQEFYLTGTNQNGYPLANGFLYCYRGDDSTGDYRFYIRGNTSTTPQPTWSSDEDWTNEDYRVCPLTSSAVARFLSILKVSGVSSVGTVVASSQFDKLQLATQTAGGFGSVRIQGGTANSVLAPIQGYTDTNGVAQIRASDAKGLFGGVWAAVQGSNRLPKSLSLTAGSSLAITTAGVGTNKSDITVSGAGTWYSVRLSVVSSNWSIEKHGRFACYRSGFPTFYDLSTVQEGDWVVLSGVGLNASNAGRFRVVRVVYTGGSKSAFWVENPAAVAQDLVTLDAFNFYPYDSVLPGDSLVINTNVLGASNIGTWTVDSNISTTVLRVVGNMTAIGATALGTNYSQVQALPKDPSRLIKKLVYLSPNPTNSDLMDVAFDTTAGSSQITVSGGATIEPFDKLGFSERLVAGIDGYKYNTGLIQEANRVIYGDPKDTVTYPGIAALGAEINISGPLVRRVTVSLAIRVRFGVPTKDAIANVKSAVAAVINDTGVGQSIAISDLVDAAKKVSGVQSVAVISPTYNATNDLIPIQAFEKPMVLNVDTDVFVSVVGT